MKSRTGQILNGRQTFKNFFATSSLKIPPSPTEIRHEIGRKQKIAQTNKLPRSDPACFFFRVRREWRALPPEPHLSLIISLSGCLFETQPRRQPAVGIFRLVHDSYEVLVRIFATSLTYFLFLKHLCLGHSIVRCGFLFTANWIFFVLL